MIRRLKPPHRVFDRELNGYFQPPHSLLNSGLNGRLQVEGTHSALDAFNCHIAFLNQELNGCLHASHYVVGSRAEWVLPTATLICCIDGPICIPRHLLAYWCVLFFGSNSLSGTFSNPNPHQRSPSLPCPVSFLPLVSLLDYSRQSQ